MKRILGALLYLAGFTFTALFLAPHVTCWAQTSQSSLRGTVVDSSSAIAGGAQITLERTESGFRQERISNDKGEYTFIQVPPGQYRVTVKMAGFGRQVKVVELLVDQPATVNFSLSVESNELTVNVTSESAGLNTTDATIGNALDNHTIEALPMEGRNVPDLLSLQPGVLYLGHTVNQSTDSRSGSVAGARSDQGNLTLDGLDNNDQTEGYAFTGVLRSTIDSVQEFRVTTTGANADAGRSSGAQISVVTKSGTNALHGGLYEYNRNTMTAANNWFNKQAQLSENEPNEPGKLIRNTYGAVLGGPIKRDKLFYFLSYEGQRTAENQQQTLSVPTDQLRAGNVQYTYTPVGGSSQTVLLDPAQIAEMDPNCTANKTCPLGAGDNPNALAVLNQFPHANGYLAGDGLNIASYSWSAPNPTNLSTYIARLDYNPTDKLRFFVRGNLQGDKTLEVPQFPGDAASSVDTNNTKGIAAGSTWTVSPNLLNNLRYGFTRQGFADRGAGTDSYVDFYGISSLNAENRTTIFDVPVHNLIDDLVWTHGTHTIQVGVNYRLIHNQQQTNSYSFDSATTEAAYLLDSGIAGTGQSLDPGAFGHPAVDSSFLSSYNNAISAATGLVPYITARYNYDVSKDGKTGSLLPEGALINRTYKANELEYYLEDSWRVTPKLTLNIGLRHTFLQTPYEVNGQQVAPTIDLDQWFETRGKQAALGNSVQPAISFAPSGQARGLQGYWPMNKNNLAPRFSFAFSANEKTSIRAGFGIYYDHYGQGIVDSFSRLGSFGLTSSLTSPQSSQSPDDTLRYTGINDVPALSGGLPSTVNYPLQPSTDPFGSGFAISYAIDNKLKTPYSMAVDLSVQRQLPWGFSLETAYVGRFGRHLMQQMDLAMPLDLVDPKSGTDYFTAATQLSKAGYAKQSTVGKIAYWENLFPDAASNGNSATQNIYNLWRNYLGNETFALYLMDIQCYPGCGGKTGRYWQPEYSSLYAWVSNGTSNYNAGQFILRHPTSHGLQIDFSYTISKSLDLGSDSERTCVFCGSGGAPSTFGEIQNSWKPSANYGPSDFDTHHLVTSNWVYQLPIGRGRRFGGGSPSWANQVMSGWQLSGLARWTSGLPFSLTNGQGWPTNWIFPSALVQTGPVKIHKHITSGGSPEVFADPGALETGWATNQSPLRNALPGEAGQRNNFRGDGYFGVDSGLSKTWNLYESHTLQFTWEVFNVTNSVRFDVSPNNGFQSSISGGSLGIYGALLTQPRVQQFSLRYAF